jgi:hypothetical protein
MSVRRERSDRKNRCSAASIESSASMSRRFCGGESVKAVEEGPLRIYDDDEGNFHLNLCSTYLLYGN